MSILSRLFRPLIAAGCLILLGACASHAPEFVPPAERPMSATDQPWPKNHVLTLAYHDVEDRDPDQRFLAVRTDLLVAQMQWLHDNGYRPVSVDQILAAHHGGPALPPKAVLLTFDDGYSRFYTRVFPILKAFGWPAVWAPVGRWVGAAPDEDVNFGGRNEPRQRFATWDQVREVSHSGLVEIASHTYDQHKGIPANPQGNQEPAETTHRYDADTQTYESDQAYRQRIHDDAVRITRKILAVTGKKPRVWVWPYGAASGEAIRIISKLGYQMALTLGDGLGSTDQLMSMPRMLVTDSPGMQEFANDVVSAEELPDMRAVQVDLDEVYDPDPVQTNQNLGELVQRIADMRINTVFLQAFADPSGDGLARSVYFPNRWLPMRADLLNRAVWQLRTRAHVKVYAWMPVLSFDLAPSMARVMQKDPGHARRPATVAPGRYRRLSPFDARARTAIIGLYEDMARSAPIDGVLFHDDATLGDFEDASPPALAAYRKAGLPASIAALRADPATEQQWTRFKSRFLIDFTRELSRHVRAIRGPQVKTARNLYAEPILNPESEAWFAQNLNDYLSTYDWTVPMAMPLMEGIPLKKAGDWIDRLVHLVKAADPGALGKTVFELQSRDWRRPGHPAIDARTLASWMERLQLAGVRNFGYYPDDFIKHRPALGVIRPALSNAWYPYDD